MEPVELVPVPDRFDDDDPLVPLPVEPMLPVVVPLFRPDVLLFVLLPEPVLLDPVLLEPVLLLN